MEIKLNELTRNRLINLFQQENLIANQKSEIISIILDANNAYSADARINFSDDLSVMYVIEEEKNKE